MAGVDDDGRIRRVVLDLSRRLFRSRRQAIIAVAGEGSLRRIELKMARSDFDATRVLRDALTEEHARRHPVHLSRDGSSALLTFAGPTAATTGALTVGPDGATGRLNGAVVPTRDVLHLLDPGPGGASILARRLSDALVAALAGQGVLRDGDVAACLTLEAARVERSGAAAMRALPLRPFHGPCVDARSPEEALPWAS